MKQTELESILLTGPPGLTNVTQLTGEGVCAGFKLSELTALSELSSNHREAQSKHRFPPT